MDKLRSFLGVLVLGILIQGVGFGASQTPPMQPAPNAMRAPLPVKPALAKDKVQAAPEPPKMVPAYQLYTYYGDRYRDPFIPLNGQYMADQGTDRPPQISSLVLKGIIQDANGRIALLTSGISAYILRGGRLYDGRNHLMKGISGVIKSNSIILMGSDHTVREVKAASSL